MHDRLRPDKKGTTTSTEVYHDRLLDLQTIWWKRLLPVQAPFRFDLRRLKLGRTLDIGCGLGRLLTALPDGSVGVDHNPEFVRHARGVGCVAYTSDEFLQSEEARPDRFDALLLAHVAEHVDAETIDTILQTYLRYLRAGGSVHMVTPQEWGYRSDPTHLNFVDIEALHDIARRNSLAVERSYSFPFPRWCGRVFKYNEFHLHARKAYE